MPSGSPLQTFGGLSQSSLRKDLRSEDTPATSGSSPLPPSRLLLGLSCRHELKLAEWRCPKLPELRGKLMRLKLARSTFWSVCLPVKRLVKKELDRLSLKAASAASTEGRGAMSARERSKAGSLRTSSIPSHGVSAAISENKSSSIWSAILRRLSNLMVLA